MHFVAIFSFITILLFTQPLLTSMFPLKSKPDGLLTPKRIRLQQAPVVTLIVEIPTSSVHYAKPLDVRTGGKFYLETPMEHYVYSSSGRSNLHRVKVVYLMQSIYRANLMCFFLHFWSKKDPMVPWNVSRVRIPPPSWFGKHNLRN